MDAHLEALLHPVRYGIVQQLAQASMTPKALQAQMPEVAHATLYRHLSSLADAGLVVVVGEERVRGAVEKTYALSAVLTEPPATTAERLAHGALVLTLLQSDVETGIRAVPDGRPLEGLTLTRTILHMTDDEREHVEAALTALLAPHLQPRPGTHPHSLGIVLVPHAG